MDADLLLSDSASLTQALIDCSDSADIRKVLGEVGHQLLRDRRFDDALRVFDRLVQFVDLPGFVYVNALWVAQRDNTGLPHDPARARRYLAACLPHAGKRTPNIHLNAVGVFLELDRADEALQQLLLAAARGVDLNPHLNEPMFQPLRAHPRWAEVGAPCASRRKALSNLELAHAAFFSGMPEDAVPALLLAWRETRSPRIATLLDRIALISGRRGGYCAGWVEESFQQKPAELPHLFSSVIRVKPGRHRAWLSLDCYDPRASTALVALLASRPPRRWRLQVAHAWKWVLDTVAAIGDTRAIEPLHEIRKQVCHRQPGDPMVEWFLPRLDEAIRSLRGQADAKPLPARASRLCAAMEAALNKTKHTDGRQGGARERRRNPRADEGARSRSRTVATSERPKAARALLRTAFEAASAHRWPAVATALLSAWRQTRSPRIADLLDRTASCAGAAKVWRGETQEAWLALAAKDRAQDLPCLLDSMLVEHEPLLSAERIWALSHRRDPRVTTGLARLLEDPPFLQPLEFDNHIEEFWHELLDALRTLGDRRAARPVARFARRVRVLSADADKEARLSMEACHPPGPYLAHQFAKLRRWLGKTATRPLSREEERLCQRIEALFPADAEAVTAARRADAVARERQRFLDAIVAAPGDDGARLAYADWLVARGDPQGEFIRLQLGQRPAGLSSQEAAHREEELLERWQSRWLGELAPLSHGVRFERGFPVALTISFQSAEPARRLIGHVVWATVERLRVSDWSDHPAWLVEMVGHPVMQSLRWLEGVTCEGLRELTRAAPRPYELIGLDLWKFRPEHLGDLEQAVARLPALGALSFNALNADIDDIEPLLASSVAERVARLAISTDKTAEWVAALPRIDRSRFSGFDVQSANGLCFSFTRDADGRLSVLRVDGTGRYWGGEGMEPVLRALLSLAVDSLSRFSLVCPEAPFFEHQRNVLGSMLGRFDRLSEVDLPEPRASHDVLAGLVERLGASDEREAERAAEEIGKLRSPESVRPLADCLYRAQTERLAFKAVEALAAVADSSAVPALRQAVQHADWGAARLAALVLGELGARDSTDDLVWLLEQFREDPWQEKDAVLLAMAMLGEQRVAPAIWQVVERELAGANPWPADGVNRAAISALGVLQAAGSRELALRALRHGDVHARRCAASVLGLVGCRQDVEQLQEPFIETDERLRLRAALAIVALAPDEINEKARQSIARLLTDCRALEGEPDSLLPICLTLRRLAARDGHLAHSQVGRLLSTTVLPALGVLEERAMVRLEGDSVWTRSFDRHLARLLVEVRAEWIALCDSPGEPIQTQPR